MFALGAHSIREIDKSNNADQDELLVGAGGMSLEMDQETKYIRREENDAEQAGKLAEVIVAECFSVSLLDASFVGRHMMGIVIQGM